jgi:hypothetical protein
MFFKIKWKGKFMKMKNKCFFGFGVLLVFGFILAGCDTDTGGETNTDPKSIKITGFNLEGYSKLFVFLSDTPQLTWSDERQFESRAEISGSDITVELAPTFFDESNDQVKVGEPWTGSGKYYLWIQIAPTVYTGPGQRPVYFYAIDGTSPVSEKAEVNYNNADGIAPVYINEAVTTLEFSKFVYRGHDPTAG